MGFFRNLFRGKKKTETGTEKRQEDKLDPIRSKYGRIEQEEVSLSDRIDHIMAFGMEHKTFSFRRILSEGHSKTHLIVSFLAVLELMKSGAIRIAQEEIFGDIWIEMTGEGSIPTEISFEGV